MLMVPVVLVAVLFVVQFGLAYYARHVIAGAAADGAAAASRAGSNVDAGGALTSQLIDESAGSLLDTYSVDSSSDGSVVTVTVSGEVVGVLPLLGTITVTSTASAHVERFRPQGVMP